MVLPLSLVWLLVLVPSVSQSVSVVVPERAPREQSAGLLVAALGSNEFDGDVAWDKALSSNAADGAMMADGLGVE